MSENFSFNTPYFDAGGGASPQAAALAPSPSDDFFSGLSTLQQADLALATPPPASGYTPSPAGSYLGGASNQPSAIAPGSLSSVSLPANFGPDSLKPFNKGFSFAVPGSPAPGTYSLEPTPDGHRLVRNDKGDVTVTDAGMALLKSNPFAGPDLNASQIARDDAKEMRTAAERAADRQFYGAMAVPVIAGAIQYLLAVRNEKSQMKLWEKQYNAQLEMLALQTEAYENERGGGGGGGGGARPGITRGIYGGKS